jgi:hypothetical protein
MRPVKMGKTTAAPPDPRPIGPELLKVAIAWEGQVIEQDLNSDVTFENDPDGLNKALTEQTSRFAWWAMLQTRAKKRVATLERDIKVKRATVMIEGKLRAASATVDILKAMVEVDPEVERLERALIEAESDLQAVTVGRDSMKERKDSLLAVASNMREEMDHGLRVLTPQARERLEKFYRGRVGKLQEQP